MWTKLLDIGHVFNLVGYLQINFLFVISRMYMHQFHDLAIQFAVELPLYNVCRKLNEIKEVNFLDYYNII